MKKILYLFLLFISVAACKKDDDEVPSRTIFSFTGRDAGSSQEDWWILLHDNESGDFIDAKQVFENQTTTFESTKKIPSGKLIVTFFHGGTSSSGGNYAEVYNDIELGDEWSYGLRTITVTHQNTYGGEYNLAITNVPSLYSVQVSDGYGENEFTRDLEVEDGTVSMTPTESDSPLKPIITLETSDDHPKYLVIEDEPVANSDVTVDYADFKDFDKYLTVTLPEGTQLTEGFVSGGYEHPLIFTTGYIFMDYVSFGSDNLKQEINVGVLNSVSDYTIVLRTSNWIYTSQGAPPSTIEFQNGDGLSQTGDSFDDFKITGTKNYMYSQSFFGYNTSGVGGVSMIYYSAKANEKPVYTLTSDLEEKYKFDKSKITYNGTNYVVAGRSYSDFVRYSYDDKFDLNTTYFESLVGGSR